METNICSSRVCSRTEILLTNSDRTQDMQKDCDLERTQILFGKAQGRGSIVEGPKVNISFDAR